MGFPEPGLGRLGGGSPHYIRPNQESEQAASLNIEEILIPNQMLNLTFWVKSLEINPTNLQLVLLTARDPVPYYPLPSLYHHPPAPAIESAPSSSILIFHTAISPPHFILFVTSCQRNHRSSSSASTLGTRALLLDSATTAALSAAVANGRTTPVPLEAAWEVSAGR